MSSQPQFAAFAGWQQILSLGERLMDETAIAVQHDLIIETAEQLVKGQAKLWLGEKFRRLVGAEQSIVFPSDPPSFLMRAALDGCQVQKGDETGLASDLGEGKHSLAVAVPLLAHRTPVGVLQVERPDGPQFSDAEIELLRGLSRQAAIALQAARQVTIERWRIEQLSLVRTVSAQVTNLLDLDELFHRVADLIFQTFKYYYVALFTVEPDDENLHFRASAGPLRPHPEGDKVSPTFQVRIGQGIIGYVAQSGEELLAGDVSCEPRYRHQDSLPETRSEVALPLKIEGRILGVLDVQSNQPDDFDETDMLVLRAMADNVAVAVEDARLYCDLRYHADHLSAVAEVSRAVASVLDLDLLLEEVVTLIHKRFGYPFVHLFTVDYAHRQIVYRAGSGRRSAALRERGLAFGVDDVHGMIPWVARHGETLLANDVSLEPRYCPSELPPADTRAELAVPLVFAGQVLGVLDLQSDRCNAFGDKDRLLFEALADNVAIAIRNANLYRSERWRRQVADSLREVAGLLSTEAALDQVLNAVLAELHRTLPCDAAAIWLLDDDDLRLAAAYGFTANEAVLEISSLLRNTDPWLSEALQSDQPTIRTPQSSFECLGTVLEFPPDYSAIIAPLRVGNRRLGALTLAHRAPGRYGAEARAMTAAFASYAAVAIENTRLYETAREQAWVSTVLLQVAEAIQSLPSLDQVLDAVVRLVPMLVGAERCAVLLYQERDPSGDEIGEAFVPVAAYGLSTSQQTAFDHWCIAPDDVPALDHLLLIKAPIVIRDAATDPRIPEVIVSHLGFESLFLVPLLAQGEVVGAMLVDYCSDRPEFSGERLAMIRGIAHQTAAVVENVRLLEAQQEDAYVSAALLQVAQAVVSLNDLDEILAAVVRIMPILVGVEWCTIFIWEEERSAFRLAQAYGISSETTVTAWDKRYALGDFPLLDTVRERNSLVELDASTEDWETMVPSGFVIGLADSSLTESSGQQSSDWTMTEARLLVSVPLSAAGEVLGVMLVEEAPLPRRFRPKRREIIFGIAQQVALAVQNDRLQQATAERERLEREVQLAREIQETFIPNELPDLSGWDLAVTWRAAREVAGDFFDIFELPGKRMGLIVADVADKGMPAALFMVLTRALVRAAALEEESPAAVLGRVNDLLVPDAQRGMFVTAFYGVLSLETARITYANAGHIPPLLLRSVSQRLERLSKGGIALGVLEGIRLEERDVSLKAGDYFICYTDGITEAFSPEDEMFGEERLLATIHATDSDTAQTMLDAIIHSVTTFVGDRPPSDDITLMILRQLAS